MLPDWAPNVHMLIIHFPIALLVIAVLFDALQLLLKHQTWLNKTALALYGLGTLGLLAAYLSGKSAIDSVYLSGSATHVAALHEDWGLYTLIFFALFSGLRAVAFWKEFDLNPLISAVFLIAGLGGVGMIWKTSELGGQLVFKHGTAVAEVETLQNRVENLERELARYHQQAGPVVDDNGSWRWLISRGADQILSEAFILSGETNFSASVQEDAEGYFLEVQPANEPTFLLFDESYQGIEGRADLNLVSFDGTVMLVHHFQSEDQYQYLKVENQTLYQGQMLNGEDHVLASGSVETGDWFSLRVFVSGTHFYGYKNNQTITHTHGDEMPAGRTGIAFSGDGSIGIRSIEFKPNK